MIDAERVAAIFIACMDEFGTADAIPVEGVVHNVAFDGKLLETYRDEVAAMLDQLPDEFKTTGGGGWSFLNACNDRDGEQWTGLHLRMEQLFCLGIALGMAHYLTPRDMWDIFPGGMPYLSVDPQSGRP